MSTATSDDITAILTATINAYITYGLTALTVYDYIITLALEVTIMWHRRWTIASLLFFANRYILIFLTIIQLMPTPSSRICLTLTVLVDISFMIQYVIFALFSALRVYALRNRDLVFPVLIVVLGLAPVAVTIVEFSTSTVAFIPELADICTTSGRLSDVVYFRLTLIARLATILADIIVLFCTWRAARRVNRRATILTTLIRDGTFYFIILLLLNVAEISIDSWPFFQSFSPIVPFIIVLTPILISRFLLNLRQAGPNDDHTEGATATHSTGSSNMTSVYTSIIGNLGELLEHNLGELLEHEPVDTREATESEPDMPDIPLQPSQNFIERPVLLGDEA